MRTETLQFTVTGLTVGTRAALERIGQQTGRSLEDYLRELIEAEVQAQQPTHAAPSNGAVASFDPLRRREYQWIDDHQDEYAGQYVALVGDRLVAHAATLRELHELVSATNVSRPFFARVEAKDELPFGGW